jgi:hypothetical protein
MVTASGNSVFEGAKLKELLSDCQASIQNSRHIFQINHTKKPLPHGQWFHTL